MGFPKADSDVPEYISDRETQPPCHDAFICGARWWKFVVTWKSINRPKGGHGMVKSSYQAVTLDMRKHRRFQVSILCFDKTSHDIETVSIRLEVNVF
jgi:hypothetical protein